MGYGEGVLDSPLRSLGQWAKVDLHRSIGTIEETEHYVRLASPKNPAHWWGNCIIRRSAPCAGSWPADQAYFAQAFPALGAGDHLTITWDIGARDTALPWLSEAGIVIDRTTVFTASAVSGKRYAGSCDVRPLSTADDWAALRVFKLTSERAMPGADYNRFISQQALEYRQLVDAGRGRWFGAFDGADLVAALGLVLTAGYGELYDVETKPGYRRQGLLAGLVHRAVSTVDRQRCPNGFLVEADTDSPAARIYQGFGYQPVEHLIAVTRPPVLRHSAD